MITYILIMFISTSSSTQSGAAAISTEFSSNETCIAAGRAISDQAHKRGNNILTWGCFKK